MNSSSRIPNLDTVSAFVDRLIVEHLKRFEFVRQGDDASVAVQDELIIGIRTRLSHCLSECLEDGKHEAIPEIRKFLSRSIVPAIEGMVVANALLGLVEQEKLTEAVCGNPSAETLTALVIVARVANERRAIYRTSLDAAVKAMVSPPPLPDVD